MKQAEKFHRPVVCFVDTSGAFCGLGAEERGQGQAIAENLLEMSGLRTPIVSILVGEGGSGGALALAVADQVWILENAVYSVISPEGCASLLPTWKNWAWSSASCRKGKSFQRPATQSKLRCLRRCRSSAGCRPKHFWRRAMSDSENSKGEKPVGRKKAGKLMWIALALSIAAGCAIGGVALHNAGQRELPILMYHHLVPDDEEIQGDTIHIGQLQEELSMLREQGYETVTLQEVIDFAEGNGALPKKPVCLTFDDGYLSTRNFALPRISVRRK